ncbi:MAG: signal peptidase II [Rickettsiales bacterium]
MKNLSFARYVVYAALWAAADLASKKYMFAFLADKPGQGMEVLPFFNLVTVRNTGVSFGMFSSMQYGREILLAVGCLVAFAMGVWLWRTPHKTEAFALSLIIGGAAGNIVDRWRNGFVADFLDFHVKQFHWPAFNLADSVIFIGVALLMWMEYKKSKLTKG